MKKPLQIEVLSLAGADFGTGGIYPPLGFQPVLDAELGNGDYFGLYWPYGRENREPIVCDMLHDEWGIEYAFSSVSVFLKWLEINDHRRGDVEVADSASAPRLFQQAKVLIGNQPDEAVSLLQQTCEAFPESAQYWYTLATQLRRIGDAAGSYRAAVRSFAANWTFGMPPNGTLRLLQDAQGHLNDPLVERSGDLDMNYGGTKENPNYRILQECINAYLASPTPLIGLLLNQNYAYMMYMETTAFQERHKFDSKEWIQRQTELCSRILGDSRT
jgi:hypothetical protein